MMDVYENILSWPRLDPCVVRLATTLARRNGTWRVPMEEGRVRGRLSRGGPDARAIFPAVQPTMGKPYLRDNALVEGTSWLVALMPLP
uniref:Uncharacterized protein n=1 Tax=Cannabis sativa TaxID=3483 RepID=A0A803PKG3_CANSA